MIRFEMLDMEAEIYNPFKGFALDVQRVQIRRDPLLGDTSVHNPYQKVKVKAFFGDSEPNLIDDMVRQSAQNCFFCSDKIHDKTPRYPNEMIPGGRLMRGDAVLFPNLYPLAKYHSVLVLTKSHFLKLREFTPAIIENGLLLAQDFLRCVYHRDPTAAYPAINANYLFPAGASLVHPHLQLLVPPVAYSYHERLITACAAYLRDNGGSYYDELVKEERALQERYVGQRGRWHWLAVFAPMGMNEIMSVHESEQDFAELADSDVADLAYGISRVLLLFEGFGHLSFNYSILSARRPAGQGFRCMIKMVNRQNLHSNYRNDDYFLQKLLHADFIINPPEELAPRLRALF